MPAITTRAKQFESPEGIAQELLQEIPVKPDADSIAFFHCDSQIDYPAVLRLLSEQVQIPVWGGTSFTYPLPGLENETSAELMLFSRAGLSHAARLSQPLDVAKAGLQMQALYEGCVAGLAGPPKLLLVYIPMIPGLSADTFANALFKLAGDVPVFGGMTTDDLAETKAAVFFEGKPYHDRIVLIALGGDIRPVFGIGSQLTLMTGYAPTVTQSNQNIVCKLDDMTMCDYMRSIGISPEQRVNGLDALMQYGPLPCQLRNKLQDDDGVPELRCISYTDLEEGSGAFSSLMPEGIKLSFGLIHRNDVVESSRRCLYDLLRKIEENETDGYRYSALFSIPCVARYFAVLGGEKLERMLLADQALERFAISTYYGFLEIGPTQGKLGEMHNRSHNASIVMCAF